jgi:hypothetical protein
MFWTCRFSCQNKFVKLVHLVGFIIKKNIDIHISPRVRDSIKWVVALRVVHVDLYILL